MKRASLLLTLLISNPLLVQASLAQTAPPPSASPSIPGLTAKQLLEQARQRLRDRGELPPENAPPVEPSAQTPIQGTLQVPLAPPPIPAFSTYRLGTGDSVAIYVQRFQDFSFQAVIDAEGKITHAVLGKISLQGLTIDEAQERVKQAVSRYLINPIVLLSLTNSRPVQVTISGEIAKPGLYPLLQGGRVSSVLLAAGGSTERGDLRAVKIRRSFTNGTTDEKEIDLYTPLKEGSPLPDLRLQDGDVIVIPQLDPTKLDGYDRNIIARSTLVKPILTIRVLSYARGGLSEVSVPNGSKFVDILSKTGLNPDQANLTKIAIVRYDAVQQKAITFELNGKSALMGDPSQNIALQDSDVVVIGRNLIGRLTYALNTFTQPFRDILGFTLFFRQLGSSATNLFGPTGR
jgi:polysaccharide biosynthesis/export protein